MSLKVGGTCENSVLSPHILCLVSTGTLVTLGTKIAAKSRTEKTLGVTVAPRNTPTWGSPFSNLFMIPLLAASRRPHGILLATAALILAAGCKPKAAPTNDQLSASSPSDRPSSVEAGSAPRSPTVAELTSFLRSVSPPITSVVEVKMEPPARMPNTSPAANTWVFNVKLTLAPTEDLFGPASPEDTQAFQAVADELTGLARWHAAYLHSPYVRLAPGLEMPAPATPAPQLLVLLHRAKEPLTPIYGKMAAEWQVDHWRFSRVDLDLPEPGEPLATFPASHLIKGSPAAASFLSTAREAIAQGKAKQAAINASYMANLVQATRPGTLYQGQITHRGSVVAAEVRFLPAPAGVDSQSVGLEVRLPATPGEAFLYSARLSQQVPLALAAVTPTGEPAPTPVGAEPTPQADLQLRFVSASGKGGPYNETIPVALLNIQRHDAQADVVWLHLSERHLEGRLSGYVTDATGFVLKAQQTAP